jgi:hypothetical protein
MMTFMYLQNCTPMKVNDRVMPFKCFYNMKPDISHIHTFGCVTKVVLPSELLGKLDDCAAMGYLLGYKYDGAYHVWIPKLGIRESRNITFYDNTTPTLPEHGSITEVQQIQDMCTLKAPTITPITPQINMRQAPPNTDEDTSSNNTSTLPSEPCDEHIVI